MGLRHESILAWKELCLKVISKDKRRNLKNAKYVFNFFQALTLTLTG